MSRLSQSVSAMWTTVKCPKCGELVDPKNIPFEEGPPHQVGEDGKRWSFVWTQPRGDFCPKCDFPLSKYFGRIKWIRTLMVGVTIVLISIGLHLIGVIGRLGDEYFVISKNAMRIGAVIVAIGAAGVIIGGKRGAVRASDSL